MKKALSLILALCMSVALCACGNSTPTSGGDSSQNAPGSSGAQTQQPSTKDPIPLIIADVTVEGSPNMIAFHHFEDIVEERSNGEIDVQLYPASQLGGQKDLVEGLRLGTIDICNSMGGILSAYLPEVQVFDLPFIWTDKDHFFRVLDGEVGAMFREELFPQYGFEGLAFFDGGVRSIYNAVRPIYTPDDVKGLKIRVPEIAMYIDFVEALGGSATPISTGEVYSALQTGIVDGVENAPGFVDSWKHYEICKYYSYTNHMMAPDMVLMSTKVYDKLSDEQIALIKECMKEAEALQRKTWVEQENEVVDKLKEYGMEFNECDLPLFKEAVQSVWQKYESEIGKDLIDQVANG